MGKYFPVLPFAFDFLAATESSACLGGTLLAGALPVGFVIQAAEGESWQYCNLEMTDARREELLPWPGEKDGQLQDHVIAK